MTSYTIFSLEQVTPTRHWRFFDESDFEEEKSIVSGGNFGTVFKVRFRDVAHLLNKKLPTTYAGIYGFLCVKSDEIFFKI